MSQQAFADRLSRIENGKQWEPEGVVIVQRKKRVKNRQNKQTASNVMYPITLLALILLGVAMVVAARYVRFQVFGMGDPDGGILADHVVMDGIFSLILFFAVRQVANLKSVVLLAATAAGVIAGVLCMHMAVHRFPDLWAQLFGADWVNVVISTTPASWFLLIPYGF